MVFLTNEEETYYYVAKAIAELFYCQDDDLDIKNSECPSDEMWTVSGREVYLNTKYNWIEVHTLYFNEFDESARGRPTIYEFFSKFSNRNCENFDEYGKVISMYFKYFQKDYPAVFSITDF